MINSFSGKVNNDTGGSLKCPKKPLKEVFCTWKHTPKSNIFIFGSFLFSNRSRAFFSKCPIFPFSESEKCICPQVQNTSFKGFLGHFKIPPVLSNFILSYFISIFPTNRSFHLSFPTTCIPIQSWLFEHSTSEVPTRKFRVTKII